MLVDGHMVVLCVLLNGHMEVLCVKVLDMWWYCVCW